jgi:hypothetical protein
VRAKKVVENEWQTTYTRDEIEMENNKLNLIIKGLSSYYIQKHPEKVNLTISEVVRAREFDEGDK